MDIKRIKDALDALILGLHTPEHYTDEINLVTTYLEQVDSKYKFLRDNLHVTYINRWENDAQLELKKPLYLQFSPADRELDLDYCVDQAMVAEEWDKANSKKNT